MSERKGLAASKAAMTRAFYAARAPSKGATESNIIEVGSAELRRMALTDEQPKCLRPSQLPKAPPGRK